MRYEWRESARVRRGLQAQVVGETLAASTERNGGMLDRRKFWRSQRPKNSPCHSYYQWDNEKCGDLYRDLQTNQLVTSIRVIERDEQGQDVPAVSYYAVDTSEGRGYVTSARLLSDDELYDQALKECLALLRGIQDRYKHIRELKPVFLAMRNVARKVNKKRRKVQRA